MKNIILISLFTSFLLCQELPTKEINTIYTTKKFEPSGITKKDNKIYAISDNGIILSMNSNDVNNQEYKKLDKKDYEAITHSLDKLYLAEEEKDNIIQLNLETFEKENKFDIDRTFNGKEVLNKGDDGLESLSYVKETKENIYFYSANQSDYFEGNEASAVFLLEINKETKKGKIIEYFPMKIKDISDICYKNDNLIYFISDTENKLFLTDKNFKEFKTYDIPGDNQEGIYLDEETMILYIAQDSGNILEIKLSEELK